MTLEPTDDLNVEDLMEVRDRPLEDSYEVHDDGQHHLTTKLLSQGYHIVEYGDDARHADEVFFGDGPDLAVYSDDAGHHATDGDSNDESAKRVGDADDGGVLLGYIEIKCKENPEWFGRCNRRHYEEYVNHANDVDVPVFVYFAYLDSDSGFVHREGFVEVTGTEQIAGRVEDVTNEEVVFHQEDLREIEDGLCVVSGADIVGIRPRDRVTDHIPDVFGNDVIELNDDCVRSWPHVAYRLDEQRDDQSATDDGRDDQFATDDESPSDDQPSTDD